MFFYDTILWYKNCEEVSSVIEFVLEVLDVIVCIALIAAVLLQSGKGGAGSTFGAMKAQVLWARVMI